MNMNQLLVRRVLRSAVLVCGLMLVLAATASMARAGFDNPVPEIDPASMSSALALLAGGLLVYRSRRS